MKRSVNFVISLVLAIVLMGGVLPFALCDQYEAYAATEGEKLDSLLSNSPDKYNNNLALISAELSLATYTGKINQMLYDMGCSKVESVNYGGAKAYTVAEKSYKESNSTRVLIIAAQGTTINKALFEEYIKDATALADVPVRNKYAFDYMNDFCNEIMKTVDKVADKSKHYKVLITGHSLGGAAANLAAVKMLDKAFTKRSDIFCYTFGALNSIDTAKPVSKGYENIHNIYNDRDTFAPDNLGKILINNAGGKYGKFGHLDVYDYDHSGIDHDMSNYRDDVKNGIVKWSVLRKCSPYYDPPRVPKLVSVSGGDKAITIRWKKPDQKILEGCKFGYEIRYSTNDKFKSAQEKKISGYNNTSKVVKDLKSSKTYYVKIRSYKTFKGVTVRSSWSTFKTGKTDKSGRQTKKKSAKATITSSSKTKDYVNVSFTPVKAGKYYYKLTGEYKLVRSKKKDSGYKTVIKNCYYKACTNGEYIYYTYLDSNKDEFVLARRSASGHNLKKLKVIPCTDEDLRYLIDSVYKNYIYVELVSNRGGTYLYNTKNGKYTKLSKEYSIIDRSGPYVVTSEYHNDNWSSSIRKIESSGKLKKLKTIYNNYYNEEIDTDFFCDFAGNYLYYAKVTDRRLDETEIVDGEELYKWEHSVDFYRCKRDGSKIKKLGTITVNDFCEIMYFTSKTCEFIESSYNTDPVCYRYYYSTGNVKKLSNNYLEKHYYYRNWIV